MTTSKEANYCMGSPFKPFLKNVSPLVGISTGFIDEVISVSNP
jgi:hypothetical protein